MRVLQHQPHHEEGDDAADDKHREERHKNECQRHPQGHMPRCHRAHALRRHLEAGRGHAEGGKHPVARHLREGCLLIGADGIAQITEAFPGIGERTAGLGHQRMGAAADVVGEARPVGEDLFQRDRRHTPVLIGFKPGRFDAEAHILVEPQLARRHQLHGHMRGDRLGKRRCLKDRVRRHRRTADDIVDTEGPLIDKAAIAHQCHLRAGNVVLVHQARHEGIKRLRGFLNRPGEHARISRSSARASHHQDACSH